MGKNLLSTYLCKVHSPYVCGTNCLSGSSSKPFHLQIGPSFYNGVFNMGKGNRSRLKSLKLFWPNWERSDENVDKGKKVQFVKCQI
ncbi:hypothetical protein RDI58_027311 [Solanum bulbocastanum]|uniref:Uncharacterized protein n=1 Tax=Solanum bulbocastanum TaxID=147425 RepID=A0AAN8SXH6_SOLBU